MSKVLVIGDTHIPFNHPNYLRFLKELKDEYKPDRVVHIGDLVDHHALSRFVSDPDGMSSGHEWKSATDEIKKFVAVFPKVDWIIGNHDKRPFSKAFDAAIPKAFLRPLSEVYGLPETWNVGVNFEIDGVRYVHGVNSGGSSSWQNLCLTNHRSTVIGHLHSVAGVRYFRTANGQAFTLAVGCGVDAESYAMAYAQDYNSPPMLGAGLVTDGVYAEFIPMDMTSRRFYRKRRAVL